MKSNIEEILNFIESAEEKNYRPDAVLLTVKQKLEEYAQQLAPADRGCPCIYLDEPCHERCTCKNGLSSLGCMYCATYGSLEQRTAAAKRIAGWIKAGQAAQKAGEPK